MFITRKIREYGIKKNIFFSRRTDLLNSFFHKHCFNERQFLKSGYSPSSSLDYNNHILGNKY